MKIDSMRSEDPFMTYKANLRNINPAARPQKYDK